MLTDCIVVRTTPDAEWDLELNYKEETQISEVVDSGKMTLTEGQQKTKMNALSSVIRNKVYAKGMLNEDAFKKLHSSMPHQEETGNTRTEQKHDSDSESSDIGASQTSEGLVDQILSGPQEQKATRSCSSRASIGRSPTGPRISSKQLPTGSTEKTTTHCKGQKRASSPTGAQSVPSPAKMPKSVAMMDYEDILNREGFPNMKRRFDDMLKLMKATPFTCANITVSMHQEFDKACKSVSGEIHKIHKETA